MGRSVSRLVVGGLLTTAAIVVMAMARVSAEVNTLSSFVPVTAKMLQNPSPNDWLMMSRTYDGQRHSLLKQINRDNVGQLKLVWTSEMGAGKQEGIPVVYQGVMYMTLPSGVRALNAVSGATLWEYRPGAASPLSGGAQTSESRFEKFSKAKNLAILGDLIYYTAPDGSIIALNAKTGKVEWQTRAGQRGEDSSGPLVVEGKVITGRTCYVRDDCYIAAHDAKTGKLVWKFNTVPAAGQPGSDTWTNSDISKMRASPWGLPGSYDPVRRLILWGVGNPTPFTRIERRGSPDLSNDHSPQDLYSDSTLALNPDTGKLEWYYQHLPGDDWDMDYNEDRLLVHTRVSPDPKFLKWINPTVKAGEERDIVVNVGEGGGIWALDEPTGKFLWASPLPYDSPNFVVSKIDVETGRTYINKDVILKGPGDDEVACYWNTRNYSPLSYYPELNSLYVPFMDNCIEMRIAAPGKPAVRAGVQRATYQGLLRNDPKMLAGIMKVNLSTGEITRIYTAPAPGQGAALTTDGGLLLWGDLDGVLRAFDAVSGKVLWEHRVDGPIQNSTVTYSVDGKQYVSVVTGTGVINDQVYIKEAGLTPNTEHNAIYTFALP